MERFKLEKQRLVNKLKELKASQPSNRDFQKFSIDMKNKSIVRQGFAEHGFEYPWFDLITIENAKKITNTSDIPWVGYMGGKIARVRKEGQYEGDLYDGEWTIHKNKLIYSGIGIYYYHSDTPQRGLVYIGEFSNRFCRGECVTYFTTTSYAFQKDIYDSKVPATKNKVIFFVGNMGEGEKISHGTVIFKDKITTLEIEPKKSKRKSSTVNVFTDAANEEAEEAGAMNTAHTSDDNNSQSYDNNHENNDNGGDDVGESNIVMEQSDDSSASQQPSSSSTIPVSTSHSSTSDKIPYKKSRVSTEMSLPSTYAASHSSFTNQHSTTDTQSHSSSNNQHIPNDADNTSNNHTTLTLVLPPPPAPPSHSAYTSHNTARDEQLEHSHADPKTSHKNSKHDKHSKYTDAPAAAVPVIKQEGGVVIKVEGPVIKEERKAAVPSDAEVSYCNVYSYL